ncbi:hypothetical protein LQF76_01885 [Gloeomargaritales cyanobacterium VI4D9]|nr:hypothetical protein LQF76_01885 [Gloeomargaritales cyanobacterium VI4D9]
MTLSLTQTPLNTWQKANWDEFVQIADDPKNSKLKGYYYQGHCRFEPMSTGSDHANDHALLLSFLEHYKESITRNRYSQKSVSSGLVIAVSISDRIAVATLIEYGYATLSL